MKSIREMDDKERSRQIQAIKASNLCSKKTFGFYLQLAFLAGTVVVLFWKSTWDILWALLVYPCLLMPMGGLKFFCWGWTERKLKKEAENGCFRKAAKWDFVSIAIDWLLEFTGLIVMAYAIFALADKELHYVFKWICIAGLYTMPFAFLQINPGYHWKSYLFWMQWGVVATILASIFFPVTPIWGLAVQVVAACWSVPLTYWAKYPEIKRNIEVYHHNAQFARAHRFTPSPEINLPMSAKFFTATFQDWEIHWVSFLASVLSLLAGIAWTFWLRKPSGVFFAVVGVLAGMYAIPCAIYPPMLDSEDEAARKIDPDLTAAFFDVRAGILLTELLFASTAILWLGGRDASFLCALALLAVGSGNLVPNIQSKRDMFQYDDLAVFAFATGFAAVVALRIAGFPLLECFLPLPTVAFLLPVFRWFFPRSGLRGAERKAAIAVMSARYKAYKAGAKNATPAISATGAPVDGLGPAAGFGLDRLPPPRAADTRYYLNRNERRRANKKKKR